MCKHNNVIVVPFWKNTQSPPWWKIWDTTHYADLVQKYFCEDCKTELSPEWRTL